MDRILRISQPTSPFILLVIKSLIFMRAFFLILSMVFDLHHSTLPISTSLYGTSVKKVTLIINISLGVRLEIMNSFIFWIVCSVFNVFKKSSVSLLSYQLVTSSHSVSSMVNDKFILSLGTRKNRFLLLAILFFIASKTFSKR